jgi:hypothetical protein
MNLSGQALAPVIAYVNAVSATNWKDFIGIDEFEELAKKIHSIHSGIMNLSDARIIIFDAMMEFSKDIKIRGRTEEIPPEVIEEYKKKFVSCIKGTIESYPREYVYRFFFNDFPDWGEFSVDITGEIKILCENYPAARDDMPESFNPSHLYQLSDKKKTSLAINMKGCAGTSHDSPATTAAIALLKQCTFLFKLYGLMKVTYLKSSTYLETLSPSIHEELQLPDSINKVHRLKPDLTKLVVFEGCSAAEILAGKTPIATTNDEKIAAFKRLIGPLKDYFAKSDHEDFSSISAAIEWYQDSIYSHDQTFSYIAACIGLEALLGTQEYMENMTARLADRYASMMGKGRQSRNNLAKEYREVLDLRGKIVHAKDKRLTVEHRGYLIKVQNMLYEVIKHELDLMLRS